MPLDFLSPRVDRLRSDGVFETVHPGGPLGRLRRPVLILARNLCTFSLFETGALPRGRRHQAARLYARTATPYVISGSALVKGANSFGVWWWNLEQILPRVDAHFGGVRPRLQPETLAQPKGSGWRIVRLAEGYEAQWWRQGDLIASAWRRDRFDTASWSAFTRLQRAAEAAPESPPTPVVLPVALDSEAFAFSGVELSRDQLIAAAAASFAIVMSGSTLFLLGQGLQLQNETREIERATAEVERATAAVQVVQNLEASRRTLIAYRQIEQRTNPLAAAGAAIGIVALYDLNPTALDAREDVLTLTLPYAAVEKSSALLEEFEGSGYFYDLRPRTDASNQTLVIEMKTREAAPPLSAIE